MAINTAPTTNFTFTISQPATEGDTEIYFTAQATADLNQIMTFGCALYDSNGSRIDSRNFVNLMPTAQDSVVWNIPDTTPAVSIGTFTYNSYTQGKGGTAAPVSNKQFGSASLQIPDNVSYPVTANVYAIAESSASIGGSTSTSAASPSVAIGGEGSYFPQISGVLTGFNDNTADTDYNDTVLSVIAYGGPQG